MAECEIVFNLHVNNDWAMVRFNVCCKKKIPYHYSVWSIFSAKQKMNEKGAQVAIGSKKFFKPFVAHKHQVKPLQKSGQHNVEWQKAVMREM